MAEVISVEDFKKLQRSFRKLEQIVTTQQKQINDLKTQLRRVKGVVHDSSNSITQLSRK